MGTRRRCCKRRRRALRWCKLLSPQELVTTRRNHLALLASANQSFCGPRLPCACPGANSAPPAIVGDTAPHLVRAPRARARIVEPRGTRPRRVGWSAGIFVLDPRTLLRSPTRTLCAGVARCLATRHPLRRRLPHVTLLSACLYCYHSRLDLPTCSHTLNTLDSLLIRLIAFAAVLIFPSIAVVAWLV